MQTRRLAQSPIDALVCLVVGFGLRCQIPVRLDSNTIAHLRITTVIPQRWPACWGYARGIGLHPDVLQYLPDIGAVRDERDQPHLPTAHRTQQREHLVDAGDLHCPQLVRWAFG